MEYLLLALILYLLGYYVLPYLILALGALLWLALKLLWLLCVCIRRAL